MKVSHVGQCGGARQTRSDVDQNIGGLELISRDLVPDSIDLDLDTGDLDGRNVRTVLQNGHSNAHKKARCSECNFDWDPVCSETKVTYNNKCWATCRYLVLLVVLHFYASWWSCSSMSSLCCMAKLCLIFTFFDKLRLFPSSSLSNRHPGAIYLTCFEYKKEAFCINIYIRLCP